MFAIGHMALAYLLGKSNAQILKIDLNVPLILVLSIIPDIDILLIPELHRGPTHSIISALIVFIPLIALHKRKAIPYLVALISHSLIGDFLVGGQLMLLWPLTNAEFGLRETSSFYINIESPANVALEFGLFVLATIVLLKTKDARQFFKSRKTNFILIIPIFAILLPSIFSYPLYVPDVLKIPHLFYLVLFAIAGSRAILGLFEKKKPK